MSYSAHPEKSTRSHKSKRTRARARKLAVALACGIVLGMNSSPILTHAADATGIEIPQPWEDHATAPISIHATVKSNAPQATPSTGSALGKTLAELPSGTESTEDSDDTDTKATDTKVTDNSGNASPTNPDTVKRLTAVLAGGIKENFTTSAGTFYVPLEGRTAPSGMTLIGVRGTFVTASAGQNLDTAIAHINEIRKDAYNSGLVDRYVPISRSPALERTAQIRAVEATVYPGHTRPNGQSSSSIGAEGFATGNVECIAWGGRTLHAAIDQWAKEKQNYINAKNGKNTGETGHYAALIDPDNTYVGLGMFSYSSGYGTTIVGRFASNNPSGPSTSLSGNVIQGIYVPTSAVANSPEFTLQSSTIGNKAVFSASTKVVNASALLEKEINR